MHSGRCNLPLDDMLPLPDKVITDDIGEESDDNGETELQNPSSSLTTKTRFQMFGRRF